MKKIYLTIVTVSLLVCSSNAQIKKGSIFLGGDIGGSIQKTKSEGVTNNKQNGINISPVFGKAIKENLVLGVNAGVGIYKNDNPSTPSDDYKTKSYNAGVFLRKYKNIGASGFYLFAQGGLGVGYYNERLESNFNAYNDLKRINVGINAYPGISYGVSKKLHLETGFANLLSLNYFHETRKVNTPASTSKTNGFNISSSLNNMSSLYLGFRLLIGK